MRFVFDLFILNITNLFLFNSNFIIKFFNGVHIFHILHCLFKVAQGDVLFSYNDERSLKVSQQEVKYDYIKFRVNNVEI